ncbi:MAG: 2-C-methyl-D-erythritol 4-phosphate cytidylyltransferase [Bacteroidales bacterium]|nr:2-C-methyl-D-erythritol 4-phosphate cytidylyltransferase [Candidatus Physcousia equi]
MNKRRVIALLLAGGQGTRVQPTCPKQFIEVRGESVLLHTMRAFESHPMVTDIVVVCNTQWATYVQTQAEVGHITKLLCLAEGGETSHRSLCHGIQKLLDEGVEEESVVLVHDSVRPFVSFDIISRNITTCEEMGNAVTGIYSNEAYLRVSEPSNLSHDYIPREELVRAQTPITFPLGDLKRMMAQAVCDSQSLVTLANQLHFTPLHIVEGDVMNFKITLPQDVETYRKLVAY